MFNKKPHQTAVKSGDVAKCGSVPGWKKATGGSSNKKGSSTKKKY